MERRMTPRNIILSILAAFLLVANLSLPAFAAGGLAIEPSAKDKCRVCGMFVARYPDWAAEIRFTDKTSAYFDGPKDLFKYYTGMKKYDPSRDRASVSALLVKDYYSLEAMDGRDAYYVTGSGVKGPMGPELVPFGSEDDAKGFMADHAGKRLVRFGDITRTLLNSLD